MTEIKRVDTTEAAKWTLGLELTHEERGSMDYCLLMSSDIWIGLVGDRLLCIWGLIPPTFLSNQAYLWLYTTNLLEHHQFILVRHSQLVIEECLKLYPSICGHAIVGNNKAIRWLKWLGAKFGEPDGGGIPFRINKHG